MDSPTKLNKPSISITSPLITNRGINRLSDFSRTITAKNDKMTPSMPSRTSKPGLDNKGQIQMNKIIRTDVASKSPMDKSKIPLEKPKLVKQINTTQNKPNERDANKLKVENPSQQNTNSESKRKYSHPVSYENFCTELAKIKVEKNLK